MDLKAIATQLSNKLRAIGGTEANIVESCSIDFDWHGIHGNIREIEGKFEIYVWADYPNESLIQMKDSTDVAEAAVKLIHAFGTDCLPEGAERRKIL